MRELWGAFWRQQAEKAVIPFFFFNFKVLLHEVHQLPVRMSLTVRTEIMCWAATKFK